MATPLPKASLVLLTVASLLLAGCAGFGMGGGNDDTISINTDFHTGTEGIRLRFMDRSPPNTIYGSTYGQPDDINVLIEVWNRGAYSGEDGGGVPVGLYLGGFDPTIIHLPTSQMSDPLLGKSIFNAEGEMALVEFPGDDFITGADGSIWLPASADTYSPDLQITACYYYETEATLLACAANDPYSITAQQACRPGMITRGQGSQGAPVSVTVDAENVPGNVNNPGQMIFKIRMNNAGAGRVVRQGTVPHVASGGIGSYACPFNLDYADLNLVDYAITFMGCTVDSLSEESCGNCEPDGPVRLSNGAGTMYCKFLIGQAGGLRDNTVQLDAFQTPLEVRLMYGYMDSVRKHIEIRNLRAP